MDLPERIGEPLDAIKKKLPRVRLHKPTRSELLHIILSFILALLVWSYAAQTVSPEISPDIMGLPLTVDLTDTKAESYGLSLVLSKEEQAELADIKINCKLTGSRAAIGGLTKSDLEVYVDFDSAENRIGEQTLPIKVRTRGKVRTGSFTAALSRDEITLQMDRFEKQSIPVTALCEHITGADAETIILSDEISVEPETIDITGPSSHLSDIDRIQVVLNAEEPIAQTTTYSNITAYQLLDKNGSVIRDDTLEVPGANFSVEVPVKYSRVLPLTIELKNAPAHFDEQWLLEHIRLNNEFTLPISGVENGKHLEISIETRDASMKGNLDDLTTYTLRDQIPLSSLMLAGAGIDRDVSLDDGFTNGSNINSVKITLDDTGLTSRTYFIKNSDIQLINGSASYNYALQVPTGNTAVTLIGTEEELDMIEPEDLSASINLFNITVTLGTSPQSFTVLLPDTVSHVWVSPVPKVNITITKANG